MKKILILIISFIFFGCAAVYNLKPSESNIAIMQQKVPGINVEEAQQGFKLYKFNCSGCHYLHKPDDYTISGWEKVLPEMLQRAKITSEKDIQLLKNYLVGMSK